MFFRRDYRKSSGGISSVFRLFLSLFILGVLGIGLFQAYRSFAGVDPLTISPKTLSKSLLNSDSLYNLITGLLSVNPQTSFSKAKQLLKDDNKVGGLSINNPDSGQTKTNSPLAFKFAVMADSENDNENLRKALSQAKSSGAKFVVGLGDWSHVGTMDELKATKNEFQNSGLSYYVTVGDHDLWDSRDKKHEPIQNFRDVFGSPYQSFSYQDLRLILIYNTDNYFGVDDLQMKWIEDELDRNSGGKLTLVFAGTPLYHPSSDHVMGKANDKLKNQADHLINIFKKKGVDEVIAGDTHFYSRYNEPTNNLKMTAVGAVSSDRNPQTPRFTMVDVYSDGSYNIEDTEIK